MIRFLYNSQLRRAPDLALSMFRDRACQFRDRLGWPVDVDASGQERDEYDALNPLYVIATLADGRHAGSMRFLPTTGRTMLNEHFADIAEGAIASPLIWECTRFCISTRAKAADKVPARLMLGAALMGQRFHLTHSVGVFDARMLRVYRRLGWPPEILGKQGKGWETISVGLWDFSTAPIARLAADAGAEPSRIHTALTSLDAPARNRLAPVSRAG